MAEHGWPSRGFAQGDPPAADSARFGAVRRTNRLERHGRRVAVVAGPAVGAAIGTSPSGGPPPSAGV